MPLSLVDMNTSNTIKRIKGTIDQKHHLQNLGFVVGAHVSVVCRTHGNLIVNIMDSRVALSERLANKIMV